VEIGISYKRFIFLVVVFLLCFGFGAVMGRCLQSGRQDRERESVLNARIGELERSIEERDRRDREVASLISTAVAGVESGTERSRRVTTTAGQLREILKTLENSYDSMRRSLDLLGRGDSTNSGVEVTDGM